MTAPTLAKAQTLLLTEAQVIRHALDLVAYHGYEPVKTNASDLTRGGHPACKPGTLDYVMTHPRRPAFFYEGKRQKATTKATRKAAQAEEERRLKQAGYQVYRATDGDDDPIGSFTRWFEARMFAEGLRGLG